VVGKVAATGEPWRVPDVRKEPSYVNINSSIRSELCVPILGNNSKVLGVINAESGQLDAFTDADMRLLNTIAGQLGTAIEKLRLHESERVQRRQAETLREVAAILSSATDNAGVLDLILEQLKRVVPFDSASIQIVRNDSLIIQAVAGQLGKDAIGFQLPMSQDKFAHPLIYEHRTVLYEDISKHPDWLKAPGAEGVKSWIGAPLIVRGECIGVLTVDGYQPKQFDQADAQVVSTFATHAGIALENARLFEEAQDAYVQTVSALASAIDVRDSYTSGHSERLAELAVETGRLLGCNSTELKDIRWAALLHDIGKIGVPDDILRKPGALDLAETEIMRKHPEIGARIVEPVRNLASVAPIIRAHQERFDGAGYPDGLKGEQIPKIARIIAVADAYVAMTDERVYRKARVHDEAVEELVRCSGAQFDPDVVATFLKVLELKQAN
jgi:putative nucleotidyltransferase with HDIG domain